MAVDLLIQKLSRMSASNVHDGKTRQKVVAQAKAQAINEQIAEEGELPEPLQQISMNQAENIAFGFLNEEQNAFLREYFRNGRKPLAAFRVGYPNNKSQDEAARVRAYAVLKTPSMMMAIEQIEKVARQGIVLTLTDHLQNLATLRDEAKKVRQYGAAVTAETNRGKASGLYITRTEITGRDGAPLAIAAISTDEYLAARQKLLTEV